MSHIDLFNCQKLNSERKCLHYTNMFCKWKPERDTNNRESEKKLGYSVSQTPLREQLHRAWTIHRHTCYIQASLLQFPIVRFYQMTPRSRLRQMMFIILVC